MYQIPKYEKTTITLENTKPGETIEEKVTRLIQNKEPIKDGAPIIFTDRSHGVNPAYNIRTDRWEVAVDAMERVAKMKIAKKEDVAKGPVEDGKIIKGDFGKTESTAGEVNTK